MSQEQHRGMRGPPPPPPPPSQHHMGQQATHDQFQYIPGQDRSYGYAPPNTHPQHIHPTPSLNNSGTCGSYSPIDHHIPPPPHLHGNPPPVFSWPPPTAPPRFSQPPPALPHTPNIPYQAAFGNPMSAPRDCNTWHQHNPPPALQCHPLQGNTVPVPVTPSGSCTGGSLRDAMDQEEEDLKWLKEFEGRIQNYPSSPSASTTTTATATKKSVKLAEVQRLMLESCSLKEQLCGLQQEMTQVADSAEEEEWERLLQQAEGIKANLGEIMEMFKDKEFIERTKTLVKQRRTKRNRVRRRKKEMQLEKEELNRKREEEEAKIDAWRAKLQREEDTKRREEAVKREADSVLGEVRQKQSEGQRMVQLLEALGDLRHTRATQAASQGQPKDAAADLRFNTTTEMIGKIVKEQLKEYELEEQTLRVMMEESASHRSAALSAKGDANFARYENSIRKLLFGPTVATEDTEGYNGLSLETLVQRRQEWDQYVIEGDHPLASAVPLSWVLPPDQPHPSWAPFLKR